MTQKIMNVIDDSVNIGKITLSVVVISAGMTTFRDIAGGLLSVIH